MHYSVSTQARKCTVQCNLDNSCSILGFLKLDQFQFLLTQSAYIQIRNMGTIARLQYLLHSISEENPLNALIAFSIQQRMFLAFNWVLSAPRKNVSGLHITQELGKDLQL